MKTTLRYLLMVVAMVSVLGAYAQGLAKCPEAKMQSTAVMVYSGSNLPQAAASGAVLTGNTLGTFTPATSSSSGGARPGHIRRADGDWEDDELTGEQTENPWKNPIGDVLWPLMLLAGVYALMRVFLRRKRA